MLTRRLFLGALVVGLACGDESAPPVPSAMTLTSGNNQSALPGVQLPLPLVVTLTGADGAPFPNARVTWTVTAGSAALTPAVDTTDVNGVASTVVSVGTTPGNLGVTATATGVPAVSFTLTALNPCAITVPGVLTPIDTNGVASGVLTSFDCQLNGPYFTDFYGFTVVGQKGLQITMTAVFNTYMEQYHVTNSAFIAVNNDQDSSSFNSRIRIIAAPGTYFIAPSSFVGNATGAYTVAVAPQPQTLTGCRGDNFLPWITRGVVLAEQVQATDCQTTRTGNGRAWGDRVFITLTPARPLSATLASAAFNPRMELYQQTTAGLVFVTALDGNGTTVTLTHTPTAGGLFRLEMTSVDTVQTGAYTLNVTGPAPNVAEVIALPGGAELEGGPGRVTRGKARPN